MPKLRHLSGAEAIQILKHFGFAEYARRGSHVKLRRTGPAGEKQTLTVPLHREIDSGTLRAIVRQASRYIPAEELRSYYYTEE